MKENFYKSLIEECPYGYAYHKIICDQKGIPFDYEYIEVNSAFADLTGLNKSSIVGKKISEVVPDITKNDFDWIKFYGEIAIHGGKKEFEQFSKALNCWYKVTVYSPEKYYFITFFINITKEMKDLQEKTTILMALNEIVFEIDENFIFTNVLVSDDQLLFFPKNKIINSSIKELFSEELSNLLISMLHKCTHSGKKEAVIYKSPIPGDDRWYKAEAHYREINGDKKYIVSVVDITEKKNIEEALKNSEEKYRLLTENISDVIWVLNVTQNKFTYISPSIQQLSGYTAEEAVGMTLEEALTPESLKLLSIKISKNLDNFKKNPKALNSYIGEVQQPCKNGEIIWVEYSGKYQYNSLNEIEVVGVSRNIEDRKKLEEKFLYLSYHDSLTDLYNRNFFDAKVSEEIERSDRYNHSLSMVTLDLDYFKHINDRWGHPIGDEVLKQIALIAGNLIRKSDILVRMGGEEFGILMPETNIEGALIVAEKIREAFENYIHPLVGKVTASFGVAERMKSESFKSWYRRVDKALYRAKKEGRNRVASADLFLQ